MFDSISAPAPDPDAWLDLLAEHVVPSPEEWDRFIELEEASRERASPGESRSARSDAPVGDSTAPVAWTDCLATISPLVAARIAARIARKEAAKTAAARRRAERIHTERRTERRRAEHRLAAELEAETMQMADEIYALLSEEDREEPKCCVAAADARRIALGITYEDRLEKRRRLLAPGPFDSRFHCVA